MVGEAIGSATCAVGVARTCVGEGLAGGAVASGVGINVGTAVAVAAGGTAVIARLGRTLGVASASVGATVGAAGVAVGGRGVNVAALVGLGGASVAVSVGEGCSGSGCGCGGGSVGGAGVSVGGTAVGGKAVAVEGIAVSVGGTGVGEAGAGVRVGTVWRNASCKGVAHTGMFQAIPMIPTANSRTKHTPSIDFDSRSIAAP